MQSNKNQVARDRLLREGERYRSGRSGCRVCYRLNLVGDAIVSVRLAEPVPLLLVALSDAVDVPGAVGVAEINPVAVFTDSPAGSPEAAKLVGELVAVV